jgi:glycosyltransferase involved in cell wall biosynthesis
MLGPTEVPRARVGVRIAVVVALYQQAQFLVESITSALGQTLAGTGVVIVNDGCPDPASHELGTAFAAAHPGRVAYIRQPNRGPSSARNHGIRHALHRWPGLEACFFLDADNMLQPHALETMYARLKASDRIGWVYGVLERFGDDFGTWNPETPANLFRMLFENQSDTASLVRRQVFEDGLFFDESEPGYEDWEFFVRVLRKGYQGESAGYCGLLYRVRGSSRQVRAEAEHGAHVAGIMARHREAMEPRRLTAIEHEHCPRFQWIDPFRDVSMSFTDPAEARKLELKTREETRSWPPVLMIGSTEALQVLADAKMSCGTLLLLQAILPHFPVTISFEGASKKWEIVKGFMGDLPDHVFCLFSGEFKHPASSTDAFPAIENAASRLFHKAQRLILQLPVEHGWTGPTRLTYAAANRALASAHKAGMFEPIPPAKRNEVRQWPTRHFAWERHCVKLDTTYPLASDGRLQIAMATPWLKLGGTDQCIIQLSRALRRLVPTARLHLVSTREGVECGIDKAESFDEVIFLGSVDNWDRRTRLCDTVFRSMDLVINTHSEAAYESLRWRLNRPKQDRPGKHVSYLHVMDEARGRQVGYPFTAVELEHAIDGFAVISESLRSFLINKGVSPAKIRLARNAPVVRPDSLDEAMRLAEAKALRLARGERPLRLLFAGRADYQKGLSRLKGMAEILAARAVPFELTFVGGPTMVEERVQWPPGYVRLDPPTHDEARLARYYAEADVLVLLSRWEGVPLSLLDAMAHGCAVVATDVGAVCELVESGRTGFVVSNERDEAVASEAARLVEAMLDDRTGTLAIRRRAVATAWGYSWDEAARELLSFLPQAVMEQHGLFGSSFGP